MSRGTPRICSVEGCEHPHRARGYCSAHWQRWNKFGDALAEKPIGGTEDPLVRFMRLVKRDSGGCWIWQGTTDRKGYGLFRRDSANKVRAHRWIYERLISPIPKDLAIDHLCRTPSCVNPWHLEPVTPGENNSRSAKATTACRNGHPYTPENTLIKKSTGNRICRTCRTARDRAWRAQAKTVPGR